MSLFMDHSTTAASESSPLEKVETTSVPRATASNYKYVPTEPTTVRCANPKTGRWPKPKVFGYLLTSEILHTWNAKQEKPAEGSFFNIHYEALCGIFEALPDGFAWGVVMSHSGSGAAWCLCVGNDLCEQELFNAKDPERLELVQKTLDMDLGSADWYFLDMEFY
ncbi:hypothetical protein CVT26_012048 [Gymnopilus dilepis]|uniref:Uncharacterized protein n=1 Tax=Gymnopilus dilepis TaxID=231916 RepID=A0A409WP20_9AGAR|nr:hypothetical protein CVT26_012048 [Gymnopilus dilepis]